MGDLELIKNRALGEYFNRQLDERHFLRFNVENVKVKIDVQFKQREDNKFNRDRLMCAIDNYLLPELKDTNFRYVEDIESLILSEHFGPPAHHSKASLMCPENMSAASYREFIVVRELMKLFNK